MITNCPFAKEELTQIIEKIYGENKHHVTFIEIDQQKHQVLWRFDNQTWTQGQSFEVLNVIKLTGKNPLHLFQQEYAKTHPDQTGLSMPNLPSILEAWAKDFNQKHQK